MSEEIQQVIIAGYTDTGIRRAHNEDTIAFNQSLGIAVLADGMGGHNAGEIASNMAVETVLEKLQNLHNRETSVPITSSQLLEYVSNTISHSNSMIFNAAETTAGHKGMGTTLIAAVINGSTMYAGHVGDSRLYMFRGKVLSRITKDHSLVQELIDKGFYTEVEARKASVGHIVTRALGTKAEVDVDTIEQDIEPNDIFLLCSDGLSDMVPDWSIEETLAEGDNNLDRKAKRLVTQANRNGGKDNISVILMQVQAT